MDVLSHALPSRGRASSHPQRNARCRAMSRAAWPMPRRAAWGSDGARLSLASHRGRRRYGRSRAPVAGESDRVADPAIRIHLYQRALSAGACIDDRRTVRRRPSRRRGSAGPGKGGRTYRSGSRVADRAAGGYRSRWRTASWRTAGVSRPGTRSCSTRRGTGCTCSTRSAPTRANGGEWSSAPATRAAIGGDRNGCRTACSARSRTSQGSSRTAAGYRRRAARRHRGP